MTPRDTKRQQNSEVQRGNRARDSIKPSVIIDGLHLILRQKDRAVLLLKG